MITKVNMMEMGIDSPMIMVLRKSRRKMYRMSTESSAPWMALRRTSLMALLMKRDWSNRTSIFTSSGSWCRIMSTRRLMASATVTVLASPSL